MTLEQLGKLVARAEAHLDPDGIEPREQDARADRSVRVFERGGRWYLNGVFDAETAAPIATALQALISAEFRAARYGQPLGEDDRTLPQRQADALALLCRHFLECSEHDTPLGGATIIVRMSLDDLQNGTGHATIDGIDQPISAGAARRMAVGGGIIPVVLGTKSEILDWGRKRRFYTKPQKLALTERDGGCAGCGAPPGMTRVHHVNWWARDGGRTDLEEGVLLCEPCHHRIHDHGWEIVIEGVGVNALVWFIPPPHVDPARTRRLGSRARYDYIAA